MAAPKGNQLSKAEFIRLKGLLEQAVADDVIDVSSDVTTLLTNIDAEIAAR
jgi:hypothetical protein